MFVYIFYNIKLICFQIYTIFLKIIIKSISLGASKKKGNCVFSKCPIRHTTKSRWISVLEYVFFQITQIDGVKYTKEDIYR